MGPQLSSLVFQPPEASYDHTKPFLIWLTTKSKHIIPAFYLDQKAKVTLLFSHGNAEDLGTIYEWFVVVALELNVNILSYDYEGYGRSAGPPTEQLCYEDIDAAYDYLTLNLLQKPQNIVVYGRSLGSGPSLYLAERLIAEGVKLGGVILQSAMLSVFRVAFPFRFTFPWDMFPNVDRIKSLQCPVWLIHGTRDEIVPFWNSEQLFLSTPIKYRVKPFWIDGGGHNNLEIYHSNPNLFLSQFREFLFLYVPAYGSSIPGVSVKESREGRKSGVGSGGSVVSVATGKSVNSSTRPKSK